MFCISTNVQNEIIINKSHFITHLYKVDKLEEVEYYLDKVKKQYKDATHYCYAYIIDGNMKCSDDGEPSNTAGAPILHVLETKGLNHILCIVIRYFGGIKLGAGGLVRAYTKSITECLKLTNITPLQKGYVVEIIFDHHNTKQIDYILKDYEIIKQYGPIITYKFKISENDLELLKNKLIVLVKQTQILESTFI